MIKNLKTILYKVGTHKKIKNILYNIVKQICIYLFTDYIAANAHKCFESSSIILITKTLDTQGSHVKHGW